MQCPKCNFDGNSTGPHTKAICPVCGTYIKKDWVATRKLVIETDAPHEDLHYIFKQVKSSLNKGYNCGNSSVRTSCDAAVYHYNFRLRAV